MPRTITIAAHLPAKPGSDFAGVSEGWNKYYWIPWRAYLAAH